MDWRFVLVSSMNSRLLSPPGGLMFSSLRRIEAVVLGVALWFKRPGLAAPWKVPNQFAVYCVLVAAVSGPCSSPPNQAAAEFSG